MKNRTTRRLQYYIPIAAVLMVSALAASAAAGSSAYAFMSTVSGHATPRLAATAGSGNGRYVVQKAVTDKRLWNGIFDADELRTRVHNPEGVATAESWSDDIEIHLQDGRKLSTDAIKARIAADGSSSVYLEDTKLTLDGHEYAQSEVDLSPAPNTALRELLHVDAQLLRNAGISGVAHEKGDHFINVLRITLDDFVPNDGSEPLSGDLIFSHVQIEPATGPGH